MAYELKTRETAADVGAFLDKVEPPVRREDGWAVCALMEKITGEPPKMWGPSIVGFGRYSYTYASGHSGEMCRLGFSPRKPQLVLYGVLSAAADGDLERLGKHSTGKGCLYIRKLADVDVSVLEAMIRAGWSKRESG